MQTLVLGGWALFTALNVSLAQASTPVPPDYLDRLPGSYSQQLVDHAIRSYKNFEQGPFSASIHGIFREINQHLAPAAGYEDIELSSTFVSGGKVPAQLHLSTENGSIRRAPLAIVLNPLFSEKSVRQMTRFMEFFAARGFHVVVFENTFSDAITEISPDFFPGDMRAESTMHRELIAKVVGLIGAQNVSGASLIGLSYGAFLSSVIKAEDAESDHPLVNGPTFLLDPPYDIIHSMNALDGFIREAQERGKLSLVACNIPALLVKGFIIDDTQNISMNERCAQDFLSLFGFQGRLQHMAGVLNESKKLGWSRYEISSVTFDSYVNRLARVRIDPGITELNYWMERARARGYDSFLVLGSTDDPINSGFDFKRTASGPIASGHFFEVPTGGHTGLRSAKSLDPACKSGNWLDCFLWDIFP